MMTLQVGSSSLSVFSVRSRYRLRKQANLHRRIPRSQITITDVQVRISDRGAVVLLLAEGKAIPIFVDLTVALSIQGALNGEKLSRPLTHDLMHTILGCLWRESVANRHYAKRRYLLLVR